MPTGTEQRLEDIHAMLQTGHQSIRIERHSLVLWGVTAALLILFVNDLFTAIGFNIRWHKIVAGNLFIGAVLLGVGICDFRLTQHKRRQRNETLSFVQRQVTKIWWMLAALIVVINIGANFFDDNYLFYGITLVLVGLAIYISGLFSEQLLDWAGILLMLIGLTLLAATLPRTTQEWISASVFGIGLPLLALLIDRPALKQSSVKIGVTTLWLAAVLLPAAAANQLIRPVKQPVGALISLEDFSQRPETRTGEWIVRLPVGTEIPLHLKLSGYAMEPIDRRGPSVQLSQPLDMVFVDGQPDGRFRLGEGDWKLRRYHSRIHVWRLSPMINDDNRLVIDLRARVVATNR